LPTAGKQKFSFPVIVGMNAGEPLSTRAARMKIYNQLLRELDADGGHYSQELSEVDISDQDDVKVLANDPAGAVLIHLGSADFLSRYKIYVSHVQGWRQQFEKLESVDLRYERQIIVNPDNQGMAKAPPITPAAAKAAMAAGVKTAALIHVIPTKKPVVLNTPPVKLDTPQWEKASFTPLPAKPAPKKAAHHKAKPKPHVKKAMPKAAAKPSPSDANKKPAVKASTTKLAASGAARPVSASSKKKPSPAVAKNHDQQDHP
jgi:cell division protein FtsQ